ncbi:MAG: hypothetical protein CRN43_00715 [Candidatus Nephrothrix sp. EaCA]|nr:MAG: hypothetical protein CRN43_00715 [Candidatus Nephrothrix sp. EaCA]
MEEGMHEKIIGGASELIMKYGVHSVSMDEISRHLSVSKKTLYQHFKDKEELLLQISLEYLKTIKQHFAEASEKATNAIEETALMLACCRKQKQEFNSAAIFDIKKYYPKVYALWKDFHYHYVREYIIRIIKNGIKEGLFRPEVNSEIMSLMHILCVEAACDGAAFADTKQSMAEIREQLFDHYLLGLCSDKGRKLFLKHKAEFDFKFIN